MPALMTKSRLKFLAVLGLGVTALASAHAPSQAAPQRRASEFTLGNGMQVVVIPDRRAPVVTHVVWYRVGGADNIAGQSGLAHFLEHLMFRSTSKLKSGELSRVVARLGGRVVGQGGTPEQALQAAQIARFKERPQVSYIPPTPPLQFPTLLESVRAVLPESPKVYLVGGAVRDALIQRPTHDLDFVVAGDALRVARKVANALQGAYYNMNAEFATGRVILVTEGGAEVLTDMLPRTHEELERLVGAK